MSSNAIVSSYFDQGSSGQGFLLLVHQHLCPRPAITSEYKISFTCRFQPVCGFAGITFGDIGSRFKQVLHHQHLKAQPQDHLSILCKRPVNSLKSHMTSWKRLQTTLLPRHGVADDHLDNWVTFFSIGAAKYQHQQCQLLRKSYRTKDFN